MNVLDIVEQMQSMNIEKTKNIVYCPDCGCEMIKRKSKFGDGYWYGCSGYPKCKKTLNNK
jgi:ssDNA-binding Zn-finger/Zn-ribbon topoisomerase 1